MKVVINEDFGGFSLSAKAVQRLAELKGRPCYFFTKPTANIIRGDYVPASVEEADAAFMFFAFDVPNPNEVLAERADWHDMTQAERIAQNELHRSHALDSRPDDRSDSDLVRVVEELGVGGRGVGAGGRHASLKIVEIPDDVDWSIKEYDGSEHIAENHRTWS